MQPHGCSWDDGHEQAEAVNRQACGSGRADPSPILLCRGSRLGTMLRFSLRQPSRLREREILGLPRPRDQHLRFPQMIRYV
jgi:hypothetical protein